jgi:peptidyl-prolyl cis-trans isomerase D
MLKVLRKHARYFYVLFILVILSFIFWGVGTVDQSTKTAVVTIGEEQITLDEFWRAFDRTADIYREIYQAEFDDAMQEELKQSVLKSLIQERALFIAASETGITVSDNELQEAITKDPTFTRDGAFSSDIYLRTLELNRLTPQYFEAAKRRELTVAKMRRLIEDSVDLTPDEIESLSGSPEAKESLQETMLQAKRQAAFTSFINGLIKQIPMTVDSQLIS